MFLSLLIGCVVDFRITYKLLAVIIIVGLLNGILTAVYIPVWHLVRIPYTVALSGGGAPTTSVKLMWGNIKSNGFGIAFSFILLLVPIGISGIFLGKVVYFLRERFGLKDNRVFFWLLFLCSYLQQYFSYRFYYPYISLLDPYLKFLGNDSNILLRESFLWQDYVLRLSWLPILLKTFLCTMTGNVPLQGLRYKAVKD